MKSACLSFLAASLLVACGTSETANQKTTQPAADTTTATVSKPKDCQSVVKEGKLGKPDVYQESAKPLNVSISIEQDTSSLETASGCFFNNTVTIQGKKKAGAQVFKRTLLKDDLLYFTKSDEAIKAAVLQSVTYKPTFNSLKYITFSMQLIDPATKKSMDYLVTMNYFGEIIKVR